MQSTLALMVVASALITILFQLFTGIRYNKNPGGVFTAPGLAFYTLLTLFSITSVLGFSNQQWFVGIIWGGLGTVFLWQRLKWDVWQKEQKKDS